MKSIKELRLMVADLGNMLNEFAKEAGVKLPAGEDALASEVAAFMLMISAADRVVKQEEVDMIYAITRFSFTPNKAIAFIKQFDLDNSYRNEVPNLFKLAVEIDNCLDGKVRNKISSMLIEMYGNIGAYVIESDDSITETEVEAHNTYIRMLKNYQRLNLD